MPTVQQQLDHATEFTAIEEVTLALWFDLDAAGKEDIAAEVLRKGLDWEHLTSLLPSNPAERSPEQIQAALRLGLVAQEAFSRGRNALADSHRHTTAKPTRWLWDPEFGVWRRAVQDEGDNPFGPHDLSGV